MLTRDESCAFDRWWKFGRLWARVGYQHFLAGGGRADPERALKFIELDAMLMGSRFR